MLQKLQKNPQDSHRKITNLRFQSDAGFLWALAGLLSGSQAEPRRSGILHKNPSGLSCRFCQIIGLGILHQSAKIAKILEKVSWMKILQLGKFYPPHLGGIETVMQDICDGMNKRGILCDCLVSNKSLAYQENITPYGGRIFRTASLGILASTSITPQMIFKLREIIKNYDIIHLHYPDPIAVLALLLTPSDKIILTHYHSDIFKNRFYFGPFAPLQKAILKRSDLIITTSQKYINESPYLRDFAQKCIAIPIGVDMPKSDIDTSKNQNIICSVGRLVPIKGFESLIASAQFLPEDFEIHIAGGGDERYKAKLQNLIQSLQLEHRVFLVGPKKKEELLEFYAKSKYFVLPSLQESYGIVLVEALSFGLPCVSTKLKPSGSDFINQHQSTGLVIEPKDPKAIAKAILEIEKNYDLYSNNAKKRYVENFQLQTMIHAFEATYQKQYAKRSQTC